MASGSNGGALDGGLDHECGKVVGPDTRQRAAVAANRRAYRAHDPRFTKRPIQGSGHVAIV